jgi:diacylglycerol kinase (ATP)
MIRFFKSRIQSFKYAGTGLAYVIRTQKNAWIHLILTVVVLLVTLWLKVSLRDAIILLMLIGMVWIAEFLNTALEVICDLASPNWNPLAKEGKNLGAAAVLIAAVIAAIIGVVILGPPLIDKLR